MYTWTGVRVSQTIPVSIMLVDLVTAHTYINTYNIPHIETYIYIHTYRHTYIHTYIHTFIYIYIHTHVDWGSSIADDSSKHHAC